MISTTDSGGSERAPRAAPPDGLKMNSAQMKSTELKMLWKLVKRGETRKLSAADMALLLRIRFALLAWDGNEVKRAAGQAVSHSSCPGAATLSDV